MKSASPSLIWRVLWFTTLVTVALFSASAFVLGSYALRVTRASVEQEIAVSLREVELQWRTRADSLARASLLLSRMSDVRSAFLTRDIATIRDTANDMWSQVSSERAIFLILDPAGRRLTSLGGGAADLITATNLLHQAAPRFPGQASGFVFDGAKLYYTVFTPIYVDSSTGNQALLDILVTGFPVDDQLVKNLSAAAGGAGFVFSVNDRVTASTLSSSARLTKIDASQYARIGRPLLGLDRRPLGELVVFKSLAPTANLFRHLEMQILAILFAALVMSLAVTYAFMRRMMRPIGALDRGAAEIAAGNYAHRIAVDHHDELGRLAHTFNTMCDAIEQSRKNLISQERMNTIGRLSSSIVHDLRNPLAAIYGGAEILADDESLTQQQSKRLALSIYRASRHIQELLKGLADSSRGHAESAEICQLREIVMAAAHLLPADHKVDIDVTIAPEIELPLERSRMERVFLNLIANSIHAMRAGGTLHITAQEEQESYLVEIDDTGSGIGSEVREKLFQPFFSHGKKNGLGLGLALSRQTVLDHGGNLWEEPKHEPGARFFIRIPKSFKNRLPG